MRSLRKFARLTRAEQRLLIKTVMLMWAFRLGLWCVPFPRVAAIEAHKKSRPAKPATSPAQIAQAVRLASRYVPKSTCLVQALTAKALLQNAGIPAQMQIGVTKNQQQFEAHAWIEACGEVVVGGVNLEQYTRLLSFSSETRRAG